MKEIITSTIMIIGLLWGGKIALVKAHNAIRTLALEKAAKGLPPMQPFTRALTTPPKEINRDRGSCKALSPIYPNSTT